MDGGLTNNLPVDAARAMGADVVIAVNLGTPLLKREALSSILGVTGQMISILTEQNVQASLASLKPTDILILPELGDFSAADFDHLLKTIPIGEAAARKVADRLAPLALPPAQYAALRQRQHAVAPPDMRPVDEIRFAQMARVEPAGRREAASRPQWASRSTRTMLDRDMRRLYGTGDFEHVNYRILEEPGRRILSVDAVEKSWGPNYLRFGLGLSLATSSGDAFFNLLASYRKTWINALGAEWRTDLQIGRTSRIFTEFYQPLVVRPLFLRRPSAQYERRAVDIFQGNERIASYDVRYGRAALELGSQLTQYGESASGSRAAKVTTRLDTGPAFLDANPRQHDQGALRARRRRPARQRQLPALRLRGQLHIRHPQRGAGQRHQLYEVRHRRLPCLFGDHTFTLGLKAAGKLAGPAAALATPFSGAACCSSRATAPAR